VDDSPAPIPELRRLLDMNLSMNWQQKMGQLSSAGKTREAREAAAKIVQYSPTANAWITLGAMDYGLGDKTTALADFRKALELDPKVRQQFEQVDSAAAGGRGQQRLRAIREDKEFLKQLFPQ